MRYPVIILTLALAACNQSAPKQTGGTAGGEILPGSASDAMLPLDTLRSQPPLAPKVESSGKPAEKGAKPSAPASRSAEPVAAETPELAAEPAAPEG